MNGGRKRSIEGKPMPFILDSGPSLTLFQDSDTKLPRGGNFRVSAQRLKSILLCTGYIAGYSDAYISSKFTRLKAFIWGHDGEIFIWNYEVCSGAVVSDFYKAFNRALSTTGQLECRLLNHLETSTTLMRRPVHEKQDSDTLFVVTVFWLKKQTRNTHARTQKNTSYFLDFAYFIYEFMFNVGGKTN
jgi:hypothetical protein